MNLKGSAFTKNRSEKLALTRKRVKMIFVAVINSYEDIIKEGVVFDYSKRGKVKQEDFLRNRFVDDYLEAELSLKETNTEYFTTNKEVAEEYISHVDGELHNDPIDIHIVDKALKKAWGSKTKPYLAIECKRLGSISDYVGDTQKFTERDYTRLRLPFEGQLGFIENKSYNHQIVSEKINEKLVESSTITTNKQLEHLFLKEGCKYSYVSEHERMDKTFMCVYHLFLDYTNIVISN
ncbi:hypothetical protein NBRC110019_18160 [Neptunitalea chrysea]|uniref:Uncharacterized protein n=1 Tax=Neptunitalea chrysea TaxID=1647581 RepID=A0A9W6EVD3_9FLAO|nr:hypothetical protein [Neptunitalea chrysea]GLB52776.1 hypothetical protein NBRC110019_18160 [Neptunitalea chrysea]